MNLDEVKKHVKFDLIFTLLVILGVALCFLLTLAWLFKPTNAKADSLNMYCSSGDYSSCFGLFQGNQAQDLNTSVVTSPNTVLSYRYISITSLMVQPNSSYSFKLYLVHPRGNFGNLYARIRYSTIDGTTDYSTFLNYKTESNFTGLTIMSFTLTMPSQFTNNPTNFHINLDLGSTGSRVIGLDMVNTSTESNESIIAATESVVSALNQCLDNEFNKELVSNTSVSGLNITQTDNGFSISSSTSGWVNSNVTFKQLMPNLELGRAYKVRYSYTSTCARQLDMSDSSGVAVVDFTNGSSFIYTSNLDNAYLWLYPTSDTCTYTNVTVEPTTQNSIGYVPFGDNCQAWLDSINTGIGHISEGIHDLQDIDEQIKDIQQDQYDYISDNTQPQPSNQDLQNTLGLVSVSDPLSYLLTSPLSLLNQINLALNGTCQDYEIGHFNDIGNANLSSYTFKFKCIQPANYLGSSLWTTIDVIMGIGLLVLTIYKFYHAISNILTMGAENEVERQFHYLTPMAFLVNIIGYGGTSGVSSYIKGGGN